MGSAIRLLKTSQRCSPSNVVLRWESNPTNQQKFNTPNKQVFSNQTNR